MDQAPAPATRKSVAYLLAAFSGTCLCLLGASVVLLMGVANQASGEPQYLLSSQWQALSVGAIGLLGLPALVLAIRTLLGRPALRETRPSMAWLIALVLLPLGLLGSQLADSGKLPSLVGNLGQLMAVGSVVLAAAVVIRRLGPSITPRRAWGHFLLGLWAAPTLSIIFEVAALVTLIFLVILGWKVTPEFGNLPAWLEDASRLSPSQLFENVRPLLIRPGTILLILAYTAVFVPLIEEVVKTIAVWPLLRKRLSPAAAFLGGALGGAGYGLFEMYTLSQPGIGATTFVVGRTGATLIHILTTALTCWGLSEAFARRRWRLLGITYLSSVTLHALWNAGSVLLALGPLFEDEASGLAASNVTAIAAVGYLLLGMVMLATIVSLPVLAARLRGQEVNPLEAQ